MSAAAWFANTTPPETYEEWKQRAIASDEQSGKARWKQKEPSRLYDYQVVRSRLDHLRRLLAAKDHLGLMSALDDGVHGNIGGIGRYELYSYARFGTKLLISEYISMVCQAFEFLERAHVSDISQQEKRSFFQRVRTGYGRSALLLSGGGIYGNFHVGVVKVLLEHELLPNVLSGSSAGALIAAIVGTHTRKELTHALDESRLVVEALGGGTGSRVGFKALLPRLDLSQITRHVEKLVPDLTFAEAFEYTGLRINISVSPSRLHQLPRLLNAVTTPKVLIRSAVMASCAVPGVYPPAMLVAKNRAGKPTPWAPQERWYDGSLNGDVPVSPLSRLYGVNHCIVSQVNPLALALSHRQDHRSGLITPWLNLWRDSSVSVTRGWQQLADKHGRRWPRVNFLIKGVLSVLAQNYRGDINILPEFGLVGIWRGMAAPTDREIRQLIAAGERSTWPMLEMIRNCTRIGRELDRICEDYTRRHL
jgi:TAG lipase/steryl ester hydrolase/phospholipase A2/LPA acyltransferase